MPGGRRTSEAVRRDDRLDGVDAGAAMLDLEDEDADLLSQVCADNCTALSILI